MLNGLGSFKFSASGFCVVTLCHGKQDGRDFYAFIAIEPQHYGYFKKRYRAGELSSFRAFGYELVRGWGTQPTQVVLDHLNARHGVEFGVSETFLHHMIENVHPAALPALGRSDMSRNNMGREEMGRALA